MNIRNGLDYFPLETDLFTDDEKVFDLMDGTTGDAAFADFGRFMNLLCRIYRDGPAIEVSERMAKRVAHDLGLDLGGFESFVGRCVDAGLFHRAMWEQAHVLTSLGIQRRWKAAKKRTGMPKGMRQWSLLGEEGGWNEPGDGAGADDEPPARQISQNSEKNEKLGTARQKSQNPPLKEKKTKQKKTKEKEDERKDSPSSRVEGAFDNPEVLNNQERPRNSGSDASGLEPACMAREYGESKVYLDDADAPHRTPYGALEQRYRNRTGRGDFASFAAKVHGMCPRGCRASPKDVSECYSLLSAAIDKADPSKGSPWALARHVLEHDRGPRHG